MGPRSRSRDCVCRHTGTNRRHFHSTEASGVLARVGRGCSARRVACCASGRRCCPGSCEEPCIRHSRACGWDGGIAFPVSGPASSEGSLQRDDARTWWNESDVGAERESSHRFFLAGLQGSGKTTTAAKLAWRFVTKQRKRVLLASLDTSRPAAFAQLSQLASRFAADVLERTPGEPSRAIARRARQVATLEGHDVLLLDTAGLQTTSSSQLRLLAEVRDVASPAETLLVADAMSGQASAGTARAFHEELGIGGVILTRMDGDQQGGAALSMHSVAGCGIRGVGTGEGLEDLEDFHPDRTALRILGLGGQSEFLARLGDDSDESAGAGVAQELSHGRFDLNDFAVQMKRMRKMGGVGKMLEMLPGLSRGRRGGLHALPDERLIVRQLAAIDSMTPLERCRPSVIKSSRKLRIARGAGVDVVEINRLLKQHRQMQTLMKRFSKRGRQRGPGFPARGLDFPTGFSGRLRGG